MKSTLTVYSDGDLCPVEVWQFPAGEVGVRLPGPLTTGTITIDARIRDSDGIFAMLSLVEIVRRQASPKRLRLHLPYLPYGRQDRATEPRSAFALRVFADILNAAEFDVIVTLDAHSLAAGAAIRRLCEEPLWRVCQGFPAVREFALDSTIIAPDVGAAKRATECRNVMAGEDAPDILNYDKVREPGTGKITKTARRGPIPTTRRCLIVDDVCDGGRTFINIGTDLREGGYTGEIGLLVSHGVYSRGFGVFDGLIDKHFTTDSFFQRQPNTPANVAVHELRMP